MSVPSLKHPTFEVRLPSNSRWVRFRPFTVREEKILLIAMESKDPLSMMQAMDSVVKTCTGESDIVVSELPFFDVEYLFLHIRAKSVGEKITLQYKHSDGVNNAGVECKAITPVEIDLETVAVNCGDGHTNKVVLDEKYGVLMRYPTLRDVVQMREIDREKLEIDFIAKCIVSVYEIDGDGVFTPDDIADARRFIESMGRKQFAAIVQFFETMPKLKHRVEYACKGCGHNDSVTLEGITDFF